MGIVEEVERVIGTPPPGELLNSADLKNLKDFYDRMKEAGIAKKPEYTLPPLDTIGRRLSVQSSSPFGYERVK
jgi:hypothetical protein